MELNMAFFTGLGFGIALGMISVFSVRLFRSRKPEHHEVFPDMQFKIVLIVRTDLQMSKGKIAAQCGHAAVGCVEKAQRDDPESLDVYKMTGEAKVALKIDSLDGIRELAQKAKKMGLITSLVRDAGRTQIAPNSITVLGVGPALNSVIDEFTAHLKPL